MAIRQKLACNVSPLLLRLLLAIVFLWAGLGKVVEKDLPVTADNARQLVEWGAVTEDRVRHLLPAGAMAEGPRVVLVQDGDEAPKDAPKADADATTTDGVKIQRLYGIALALKGAAEPGTFADGHDRAGEAKMPLAPKFAGSNKNPVYLAWAVALTEIFAGGFMLLGFLTRISAFGLVCVMLGAMWLTEIGPAIQSGAAVLGFLPAHPRFGGEWQHLLFQLSMLIAALAVMFSGAGAASLDRLLFGGPKTGSAPEPKGE